ncbi:hypothetical protein BL253_10830 [Pseudofrankia asymbiotica]|uniref:Uncharacterized protein n=1 Tax=Pseudofrankia asymbiotica TaxID=1834516 RepID=A0A1V2ICW3_9ACTN|nr:hypothetical protein BL253_10830 [Pseudofrankia asymbiotica]
MPGCCWRIGIAGCVGSWSNRFGSWRGSTARSAVMCRTSSRSARTAWSWWWTSNLAGVDPSVGSIGDAYDNALAETTAEAGT